MNNPNSSFKSYVYKHSDGTETVITESSVMDKMDSQKMFFIDPAYIRLSPKPPPKLLTFKDSWKEFKDRISLAVQALRHGREYFD